MELLKKIESEIKSLSITNDEELKNANDLAKEINKGIKEVKAHYKPLKDETNKAHKKVVAEEKEALKPYNSASKVVKDAIGKYMHELEQKCLEEEKKRLEEEEKNKELEDIFGVEIKEEIEPQKPKVELGGTHVRKKWKARVIDEDKVPEKIGNIRIKKIDMKVLNDFAQTFNGEKQIDGVEFYQEESVVIR